MQSTKADKHYHCSLFTFLSILTLIFTTTQAVISLSEYLNLSSALDYTLSLSSFIEVSSLILYSLSILRPSLPETVAVNL